MNLSKLFFAFVSAVFAFGANAADITVFYSPTCPHCHHARDFISSNLIYEYDNLKVTEVNVMDSNNRQAFVDALYKCKYESGGVPVLVVGEKCFQGYADSMQSDLRNAIEADLNEDQKKSAAANKAEMEKNKDAFIAAHAERKNAVSEKIIKKKISKKSGFSTDIILYVFLGLLFVGLGFILFKKQK